MGTASADPKQDTTVEQQPPQPQATEQATRKRTTLLDSVIDATPEFHREVERYEFDLSMARMFAQSGLFNDIKGFEPAQAVAAAMTKISLGRTMGFTPAESMQGVEVVLGRLSIGSHLRAARMKRYGFDWKFIKHDEKGCSIRLYYKGHPLANEDGSAAIVSFGEADAEKAKLIKKDGGYEKNPKNMYFCRAISNAQRWYAPEALGAAGTELPSTEELFGMEAMESAPSGIRAPQRASEMRAQQQAEPEAAA